MAYHILLLAIGDDGQFGIKDNGNESPVETIIDDDDYDDHNNDGSHQSNQ